MSKGCKTVGVIGAGIIGTAVANCLRRDGHDVFLLDPNEPGRCASFGNAGVFGTSSVVPMSMPGTIYHVPKWLIDPLGPLAVRWSYLPFIAGWLIRYLAAGRHDRVENQARALKDMLGAWSIISHRSLRLPLRPQYSIARARSSFIDRARHTRRIVPHGISVTAMG